jgi:hypothetical protein
MTATTRGYKLRGLIDRDAGGFADQPACAYGAGACNGEGRAAGACRRAPSMSARSLEIDHLRAFDVECLELLRGKGHEFAAAVFVSFDDLPPVDLLAGSGIMRPKRDPGGGEAPVAIMAGIVGGSPRCRWRKTLLPSTPIRQVVLVHIDRGLVAAPGATAWVSSVWLLATNRPGTTLEKGAGNLASSPAALQISFIIQ